MSTKEKPRARRVINKAWEATRHPDRWELVSPDGHTITVYDKEFPTKRVLFLRELARTLRVVPPYRSMKCMVEEAYAHYAAGLTLRAVAEHYGYTEGHVSRVFKQFGYRVRPVGQSNRYK